MIYIPHVSSVLSGDRPEISHEQLADLMNINTAEFPGPVSLMRTPVWFRWLSDCRRKKVLTTATRLPQIVVSHSQMPLSRKIWIHPYTFCYKG